MPRGPVEEPESPRSDDQLIEMTLRAMDEHGIELGFLSGREPGFLQRWIKAAPGRFIPSLQIDGVETAPDLAFLRSEHAAGRLGGIGEVISQYAGVAPNDSRLDPYFKLAEELDLPVLIHCVGLGGANPRFRASLGHPLLLEDVLVRHPRLRLWVENAGFPFFGEILSLMYRYPNVYADLSTISWLIPRPTFHDYLGRLVEAELGERLMFGSDQMSWPQTIAMAIDGFESATFLNDEQKRDIYYKNAVRFLRLGRTSA